MENLEKWRILGATITDDNGLVVTKCDIIFICVKPHLLHTCASQVEGNIDSSIRDKDRVFVSVLAGVTLDQLELVNTGIIPEIFGNNLYFFSSYLKGFQFHE